MNNGILKIALLSLSLMSNCAYSASYTLYTETLAPYAYKNNNQLTGVAVEIVSQLFKNSGHEFVISLVPWKRAYESTLTQANSCVFPIQRNQERESQFQWVSPILISHSAFYTLKKSPVKIETISDINKLSIGSYLGSATAQYLTSQGFQVDETQTDSQNLFKLNKQRISVWASDTMVANYQINKAQMNEKIDKQLVYFTTLRALACNIDTPPQVIKQLSQELRKMYINGTIEAIMTKYN